MTTKIQQLLQEAQTMRLARQGTLEQEAKERRQLHLYQLAHLLGSLGIMQENGVWDGEWNDEAESYTEEGITFYITRSSNHIGDIARLLVKSGDFTASVPLEQWYDPDILTGKSTIHYRAAREQFLSALLGVKECASTGASQAQQPSSPVHLQAKTADFILEIIKGEGGWNSFLARTGESYQGDSLAIQVAKWTIMQLAERSDTLTKHVLSQLVPQQAAPQVSNKLIHADDLRQLTEQLDEELAEVKRVKAELLAQRDPKEDDTPFYRLVAQLDSSTDMLEAHGHTVRFVGGYFSCTAPSGRAPRRMNDADAVVNWMSCIADAEDWNLNQ